MEGGKEYLSGQVVLVADVFATKSHLSVFKGFGWLYIKLTDFAKRGMEFYVANIPGHEYC